MGLQLAVTGWRTRGSGETEFKKRNVKVKSRLSSSSRHTSGDQNYL